MPRFSASSSNAFGSLLCSKPVPSSSPASSWSASLCRKRRWRGAPVSWIPVVSSSSPPESHGVGSSSSEMWTQRIGRSAPCWPAASWRPHSDTRVPTVSIAALRRTANGERRTAARLAACSRPSACRLPDSRSRLHLLPRLLEHRPQHSLDLPKLLGVADQRGRQLDHRVAAIVRAADEPTTEELAGEESAQEPLRLLIAEAGLRLLVLDQLDRVEVPVAAHVADDRDVAKGVEHGPELSLLSPHVPAQVLALEQVEVRHRYRGGDGMTGKGEAVGEALLAVHEGLGDPVRGDQPAHRRVRRGEGLGHRDDVGAVAVALA